MTNTLKFSFLVIVLLSVGCRDYANIKDVEVRTGDPEYAVPIVTSRLDLQTIFEEANTENAELLVNSDSSMSLKYSGDVLMQSAADIFPPIPGYVAIEVMRREDTIPLPFQRLDVRQAILKGDTLVVAAQSSLDKNVFVHVEILSLTQNGSPVTFDIPLNYSGKPTVKNAGVKSMAGMKLELINNELLVNYSAKDENGDDVNLDYLEILWDEMTFQYVEGYFSKNEVNIPGDSLEIEVYDKWINGKLYFDDPTVEVLVDNSFGFPVRAEINKLRFIGRQDQIVDLLSPQNDSINFLYPELHEVGSVKRNLIVYDGANSNIADIINIQPKRLEYDIDAIGNPDEDTTIIGFFTDTSFIRINVSVELPLRGWANDFTARDTLDFNLDNTEDLESIEFKMVFDNGMPINFGAQLYLIDAGGQVLDSMFVDQRLEIAAADVDASGKSVGEKTTIRFENFTDERIAKLKFVEKAILEASFLTNNAPNQSVAITSGDALELRVGAKIKLK